VSVTVLPFILGIVVAMVLFGLYLAWLTWDDHHRQRKE